MDARAPNLGQLPLDNECVRVRGAREHNHWRSERFTRRVIEIVRAARGNVAAASADDRESISSALPRGGLSARFRSVRFDPVLPPRGNRQRQAHACEDPGPHGRPDSESGSLARSIVEGLRDLTVETAALFKLQEDRGIRILEFESGTCSRSAAASATFQASPKVRPERPCWGSWSRDARPKFCRGPRGEQRARLEEEIKLARQRGYATSRGEIFVGAVAVLTPYFDHRGSVVGSVGIYGPSARVDEQKMVEYSKLARKAGQEISVALRFKKLAAQQQKERQ